MLKLYGYFRSSAAYRVRIALALKGLAYDQVSVHLRKGEHRTPQYRSINPTQLLPTLVHDDAVLMQSPAILEYLEEVFPAPALLPSDALGRAKVRALMNVVCCDIHPVNNLRILQYLEREMGQELKTVETWYNHWIAQGFAALEDIVKTNHHGRFCYADEPSLADVMLVPQVVNAGRYGSFDYAPYPHVMRIYEHCMALPAFADTHPSKQPDAEG
ncbi:MAG: maleylacetoacetate isomerase [Alphaproteobacteria bacterium]|nr:maleylacetoacetate isomerase [Alphaproteobacteria bacterium]TAD90674.1 MAG: maleylacetoacetate isomerase [Alphaproteobacteria bacterium]